MCPWNDAWSGSILTPPSRNSSPRASANHVARLCLASAGLQPVYVRYGTDGVLHRLVDWCHDAETGQLVLDHWEPVPMGDGQDFRGAYYDIAFFQKLALSRLQQAAA